MFLNRKGQNTAEYAIVIGLVVAALFAMQTYVKRGVQARVKDHTDDFSTFSEAAMSNISTSDAEMISQYEPTELDSKSTPITHSGKVETIDIGGTISRDTTEKSKATTGDYQQINYQEQ